jgi:hypothetical protein
MSDTYEPPPHGWTCFHCGETFTTVGAARDHFGADQGAEPGCLIDRVALEEGGKPERGRGLLMALRKAEDEIAKLRAANEQLDHEAGAYHAMSAELERYFGEGVRSAHHAWLRYEAKCNEVEALLERVADRRTLYPECLVPDTNAINRIVRGDT